MNGLPDNCLRGLRKKEFLTAEGLVSGPAFLPDPNTAINRQDGGSETSINWEDNETVFDFTFRDRSHSEWGVARLPRRAIDYQNTQPGSLGALNYERAPLNNNQYHGNIIFHQSLPKTVEKMIASALALASTAFPRNPT